MKLKILKIIFKRLIQIIEYIIFIKIQRYWIIYNLYFDK